MYTILVVDDEKDIVSALEIYLKAEGYRVLSAGNGKEALSVAAREDVHLILMDIMMPVMDGLTAMAQLRQTSNVPVILLTAKGEDAKAVTVDGDPVALTPKEYDILRFLMQNAGTVFSPSEIYRRVWDDVPLNATGAIAVHIRHLREKLEINPSEPRYIKVVWGKGYKMEGTLT